VENIVGFAKDTVMPWRNSVYWLRSSWQLAWVLIVFTIAIFLKIVSQWWGAITIPLAKILASPLAPDHIATQTPWPYFIKTKLEASKFFQITNGKQFDLNQVP